MKAPASGRIFAYQVRRGMQGDPPGLRQTHDLSAVAGKAGLADPRGLAVAVEQGHEVLDFLDWGRRPVDP